jgi:hypothetical protein
LDCIAVILPSPGGRKRSVPNSGGSTDQPKLYLGRKAGQLETVIGSANLTGGLRTNVEAAVSLRGHASDVPLRRAPEGPTTSGHPRAA